MGWCYELDTGCCGFPIRSTVCTALCHYMVYGIFVMSFVFTNTCYPPFYFVDYFFGGSGAALTLFSFLTACAVDLKNVQFLRCILVFFLVPIVIATCVATFYYVIERWHDIMVTAFTKSIRNPIFYDRPDLLWFILSVLACLQTPAFLIYLIYIISFMCNKWKSYLFTSPYQNNIYQSALPPLLSIPADTYSSKEYKPYPTQQNNRVQKQVQI